MGKPLSARLKDQEDLAYAYKRVNDLLSRTSVSDGIAAESTSVPILNLVIKSWNGRSGTFSIQVLIVISESGHLIDISTEVARILGLKYSQTSRGVLTQSIGSDVRHILTRSLSERLYGTAESLTHWSF